MKTFTPDLIENKIQDSEVSVNYETSNEDANELAWLQ